MAGMVIISPELSGGVGDYTRRLLENLPQIPELRVIVPKIGNRPATFLDQYPIEEIDSSARSLRERLPTHAGTVMLQYSPYGFDWLGYPRWLINGLLQWKRQSHGSLVIMFHEIWTFWPIWNKNRVLQYLHRRDLGRLLQLADFVFTSTASQAEHLSALGPSCPIKILPVGSNIRRFQPMDEERENGFAILFGLQSSRIRALRKMEPELKSLSAVGRLRKIVTVGSGGSRKGDEEELALLLKLELADGFEQRGPLPEERISDLLSSVEFGIAEQNELSITKSGTFMAYAAHGLNILSCHADRSKSAPISLMTSAEELKGLTPMELQRRGEKLREWQERTSAWPLIAREMAQALGV
jgi:hypothetical protein